VLRRPIEITAVTGEVKSRWAHISGNSTRAQRTRLDALADSSPSRRAPRCAQVKAIQVHHFAPRSHEVLHELRVRVRASVYF
jgi:hypothetical protein